MSVEKPPSLFEALGRSYTIPTDEAGLRKVFAFFDHNSDGNIDFREFSSAYIELENEMGVPISKAQVGRIFRKYAGKDGDLQLDFSEFSQLMLHRAAQ